MDPVFRVSRAALFDEAQQLFNQLGDRLETAGYPVSCYEIDEGAGIWTVEILAVDHSREEASELARDWFGGLDDVKIEALPDTDWVTASLQGLAPVRAGRFFVHGSHDRDLAPISAAAIEIDANQAFGTGHHGTTAGCLEVIDGLLKRRSFSRVLDLGCGSGVLAIAIAKAAHIPVIASDIDPVAVAIAERNARINNVGPLICPVTATGFDSQLIRENAPYDLIVANILARPLMEMATQFVRHLTAGGIAILSGLRPEDRRRIVATYRERGLHLVATRHRDDWITLTFKNR